MTRRAILALLFLSLTVGRAFAQGQTPKDVVSHFASLDAEGARLRSGPNDPIWKLTLDDGETPVAPIVLIDKFDVARVTENGDKASVSVRYAIKGVVRDSGKTLTYVPGRRTANEPFSLARSNDEWKISLEKLRLAPHVTTEGYLHHLDKLLSLYDPQKDAADPRYRSLTRLKATLQKTATAK